MIVPFMVALPVVVLPAGDQGGGRLLPRGARQRPRPRHHQERHDLPRPRVLPQLRQRLHPRAAHRKVKLPERVSALAATLCARNSSFSKHRNFLSGSFKLLRKIDSLGIPTPTFVASTTAHASPMHPPNAICYTKRRRTQTASPYLASCARVSHSDRITLPHPSKHLSEYLSKRPWPHLLSHPSKHPRSPPFFTPPCHTPCLTPPCALCLRACFAAR